MVENNTTIGRDLLAGWLDEQPDNYFNADRNMRHVLERYWGANGLRKQAKVLYKFGGVAATRLNDFSQTVDLPQNQPQLQRFDGIGRRVEAVMFHPDYHEAGRLIYGSGVMSVLENAGNNLLALALFYLSAQNGEAGHNCPLACTAGAIKVLQAVGSDNQRADYLTKLIDPNYDTNYHAAQFLTEVQGGSDVGANATTATHIEGDVYHISGEKWFCSNVTAEVILLTARVAEQGDGTAGLGLFLVPRHLPNGDLNHIYINRLKDKLGTRSMASGEVEFRGAIGYAVGDVANGFKNVMHNVVNTSRIYNAVATTANARRAYAIASSYAKHRLAFGQPIMRFPVVQDMLARMRADVAGIFAGSFYLAHLLDQADKGKITEQERGFVRMALNLNKMRSAMLAHDVINHAIELLGGNGAIESFSVLPRLLRDNVVYENWEGTHNVLLAQVQRDMRRTQVHEPFTAQIRAMLSALQDPPELKQQALEALDGMVAEFESVLAMDRMTAGIYMRPLMLRLTDLYYTACMMVEAQYELAMKKDRSKQRLALLFFSRRVQGKEPKDIPYYDNLVSRLAIE